MLTYRVNQFNLQVTVCLWPACLESLLLLLLLGHHKQDFPLISILVNLLSLYRKAALKNTLNFYLTTLLTVLVRSKSFQRLLIKPCNLRIMIICMFSIVYSLLFFSFLITLANSLHTILNIKMEREGTLVLF